jgi:hypothetical protein
VRNVHGVDRKRDHAPVEHEEIHLCPNYWAVPAAGELDETVDRAAARLNHGPENG